MEEFKSGKIKHQMMLNGRKDDVIKSLKPTLKTGKKRKVRVTTKITCNLAFKEIIGHIQTGRKGLETDEKQRWSKTTGKPLGYGHSGCKERGGK